MNSDLTFFINNLVYTIEVEDDLKEELTEFLNDNENLDTKDLLYAYVQKVRELLEIKKDIKKITTSIDRNIE
jgi:hypothetical protein